MDKKTKKKWVRALRSGKYKQGAFALRRDDSYCCLGVLCDISGLEWRQERILGAGQKEYSPKCSRIPESLERVGVLPPTFRKKIGLTRAQQAELINMNDGCGMERQYFLGIADWIDENL